MIFEWFRFNLWVFRHSIRRHKMEVHHKTLDYPFVHHEVTCKTCNETRFTIYPDGLENYYGY